jgi:hypothetical protein
MIASPRERTSIDPRRHQAPFEVDTDGAAWLD